MKISNNFKTILFKDLNRGDVFRTEDGFSGLFMKTVLYSGTNAVNILDGNFTYYGPDAIVYPVDCELVLH